MDEAAYEADWQRRFVELQPWTVRSGALAEEQRAVQRVLARRCNAVFGTDVYIAPGANVFTSSLKVGDRSWIAGGATIRGAVEIGRDCSINQNAHVAGRVRLGDGVRVAADANIYGFNHGTAAHRPIHRQPLTVEGIDIGDDVWIGTASAIVDGVKVGSHSVVAAGAIVTKSVAPYSIVAGNPARVIKSRHDTGAPVEAAARGEAARHLPAARHLQAARHLTVRQLLHETDPYAQLQRTYDIDMQGWGSHESIFEEIIAAIKPTLVVEIGTWKGASAIHMAKLCAQHRLAAEIVCVDTWLGNWQHWSRTSGIGSRADLKLVNGFPHLYFQFLSNVVAEAMTATITPLPLTGIAAAKLFAHHGLKPDLLYIDGDHEYESVIGDLMSWVPLVNKGGAVLLDDYVFPGVKRAVHEYFRPPEWTVTIRGNKVLVAVPR